MRVCVCVFASACCERDKRRWCHRQGEALHGCRAEPCTVDWRSQAFATSRLVYVQTSQIEDKTTAIVSRTLRRGEGGYPLSPHSCIITISVFVSPVGFVVMMTR